MSSLSYFVGLDYHQSFIQVCVLDREGNVLANLKSRNSSGHVALLVRGVVPESARVFVALEACAGAANFAEELDRHTGWSVGLAHAGYVAKLKQSPDKTDFSDARLLADLERVGYLPRAWLPPESLRDLRRLVRYRQQLAAARRNVKLRITALLREERIVAEQRRWTKAWRHWLAGLEEMSPHMRWVMDRHLEALERLEREIRETETRLSAATCDDPIVQKLLEIKGVGLVTAVTLRAEIGRFDRFRTGKQLARFCGMTPRNASSGNRQADAGLIKAGNPELRRVIIEAAHRLGRYDARLSKLHARLRRRGKPGSVVAAAIANRWMRWLYHQMKTISV